MPRKPPKVTGTNLPTLVPPTPIDKEHEKWYRRASDISHAVGPSMVDEDDEDNREDEPEDPHRRRRPARVQWGNQLEFLMSCIATSVGLGNVWRFPFVAYQNGGGAFLIPYMIVLLFIGKPMYYLECILGQFSSRNSVRVWSLCPAMKGVGYAQSLACSFVLSYYVMIIALCLLYFVRSFEPILPWAWCKPEWGECMAASSGRSNETSATIISSAEHFFLKEVLQQSNGIEDGLGMPIWYLTLSLFMAWCMIFAIIAQGVRSSGKAAYFLAIFPYFVMIILLVTTATLPGAPDGMLFFITPQWEKLSKLDVWYSAVTQVFFSLSVCNGAIIMFSSYNGFKQNIYRDSLIVTTLDTMTSLISGFTIFGILGNLAYNLHAEIGDVLGSGGTGLAFISYPDAIAKTFLPQLFSVLFFLMMSVLGVGSAVALHSTINTVLLDAFPNVRTIFISAFSCFGGFLIGLVYTTPGGQYILELIDYYGGTFLVLFTAIAEIIGVFWIYGLENFCLDVEFMLNRKTSIYWRFCWGLITPGIMIVVFFYALLSVEALVYGGFYVYPLLAYVAGYIILSSGFLLILIFIGIALYRTRTGKCKETVQKSFSPKKTWGPRDPLIIKQWIKFKREALAQQELKRTSRIKHIFYSLTGSYRKNIPLPSPRTPPPPPRSDTILSSTSKNVEKK